MDDYERTLLQGAIDLLHRLVGRLDARKDFKPILRFVEDDPTVIPFPGKAQQPSTDRMKAVILEKESSDVMGTSDEEQGFLEFTEKELQQMPKQIKQLITVNRKRCYLRRKSCGNGYTYEIRFRAGGYNISAGGKTIALAKANMLHKMKTAQPKAKSTSDGTFPLTFGSFALYFFEKFRKAKVSPITYHNDSLRLKLHIIPAFEEKSIRKITPTDCELLISRLQEEGKGKTAEEIYSLLSIIFRGAMAHGIITQNPMSIVPRVQHTSEHGKALSKQEITDLFDTVRGTHYEVAFALALYTGLRPNELKTATIRNGMIVAKNSKQHHKKLVFKRIPLCSALKQHLPCDENCAVFIPELKSEKFYSIRFHKFCPNHKLYDLRTTFYSRCKELGVAKDALDAFMGHSCGKIGNAYTDLSDEYLLKEGKKLDSW